jgi:signal transduction histidine kinase/CheY-like chemotaxis protein
MVTGEEDDAVASEALRLGAEDYIVKDAITGPGLARAIENAIEKFQIRRALEGQRVAVEMQNRRLELLRDELQARMLELADATRAKDRFLAVMSHEMRTPLNAILGYADLLEMGMDGELSTGQRQYLDRLRVGGRHLLDLINDVLDLTRADARKLELDLRPVDLEAVIEEVAALLEGRAAAKGLSLEIERWPVPVPHVQADLQRLRQVLTNLVGNAVKFTDEGAVRIRCRVPEDGGPIGVEVSDTGIGIEPEVLPLVFNEFYQARDGLTRRHDGSGLGLAISRRLAALMEGELIATSAPGAGSTFTLWLRRADPASPLRADDVARHQEEMAAHAAADESASSTAARIVTVVAFGADSRALAELEQRMNRSVRLAWTVDPLAVAPLARAERASLVVLDTGGTDGAAWRAAQALQEDPALAAIPVLLLPSLSAAMPGEATQMLDLGWVSLVPKPFTAAQLTHAIVAAAGSAGVELCEGVAPCDVLVVDDDPDSRRVAARFLTGSNVQVREAADGESALLAMRARTPDVIVLDLMMPVLDGFGVLAAMRADSLLAGIPAVVLTAKSLTEAERQFLSRTAARVLQKGQHRLADVAALVLRAAEGTRGQTAGQPAPDEG